MPAITCTSWAPPGPANPPSSPSSSAPTSPPAGVWWSSTPRATWSSTCLIGFPATAPAGSSCSTLMTRRPPRHCAGRLVVFDPDDPAPPPVLNVVQSDDPGELDVTVDNLVGVFGRIF